MEHMSNSAKSVTRCCSLVFLRGGGCNELTHSFQLHVHVRPRVLSFLSFLETVSFCLLSFPTLLATFDCVCFSSLVFLRPFFVLVRFALEQQFTVKHSIVIVKQHSTSLENSLESRKEGEDSLLFTVVSIFGSERKQQQTQPRTTCPLPNKHSHKSNSNSFNTSST